MLYLQIYLFYIFVPSVLPVFSYLRVVPLAWCLRSNLHLIIYMYKKEYTPEDIKSIHDWFEAHKAQMPDQLQLDAATFYKDLKDTVNTYFEVFDLFGSNPTFSGQYHQLWLIKAKLEEMGIK